MVGAGSNEKFVTSWGWRGNHRLWRIRWHERPGQYAEVTGPHSAIEALIKCSDEVLERLPWRHDSPDGAA